VKVRYQEPRVNKFGASSSSKTTAAKLIRES
jgi:hypothetical protein